MITDTKEGLSLIDSAAQSIIRGYKPVELALYPMIRDRYLADPAGFVLRDDEKDEALGFDGAPAVQTLAHSTLPITTSIMTYLHSEVTGILESDTLSYKWLEALINFPERSDSIFSETQLVTVCDSVGSIADNEVLEHGYQQSHAEIINDFFRERLRCPENC